MIDDKVQCPKHCVACVWAHLDFSYPGRALLDESRAERPKAGLSDEGTGAEIQSRASVYRK